MEDLHQGQFSGKSGKEYQFELYRDPPIFHRTKPCTYMLLKRSTHDEGKYQPVYIGDTENFDNLLVDPEYDQLLTRGDFDLLAIREEGERISRLAQTLDLVQAYFPESRTRFFRDILISTADWKKLNDYMHQGRPAHDGLDQAG